MHGFVNDVTSFDGFSAAALAACNYIRECCKPIFDVLRKLLDSDNQEIAVAAEDSMKKVTVCAALQRGLKCCGSIVE